LDTPPKKRSRTVHQDGMIEQFSFDLTRLRELLEPDDLAAVLGFMRSQPVESRPEIAYLARVYEEWRQQRP
jgi:hypothetical protein